MKVISFLVLAFYFSDANAQYKASEFVGQLNNLTQRIENRRKIDLTNNTLPAAPAETTVDTIESDQVILFNKQIAECQNTMSALGVEAKEKVKRSERWSIGGAIAGLLGSAISGHASTIVVALLSGTSGLANTAQQAYKDNGDSAQGTLKTRSELRQQALTAISEYKNASTAPAKNNAMISLNVACTMYAMTIDDPISASPTGK